MRVHLVFACVLGLVLAQQAQQQNQPAGPLPRRRYEFKNSLKGPHRMYQKNEVMFWEVFGGALVNSDNIKLVPSAQHRKGAVWNRFPVNYTDWEVRVEFAVFGRRYGADGLGIWYSLDKAEGKTFGGPSKWRGLGIFVDTYDNDAKSDNPAILGVVNNGELQYDHNNDGSGQEIGRCLADVRNTVQPVTLTIKYSAKRVEVSYSIVPGAKPLVCFTKDNVDLPAGGYFGVSAATGALADDHDLHKFEVWDLSPQDKKLAYTNSKADETMEINVNELKQWEEDFLKQQAEIEKKQRMYAESHPDDMQQSHVAPDGSLNDREKLIELLDIQKLISRQVEMSFVSINQHIDIAADAFENNFDFIKRQQQEHAIQLSKEPTAEGLLGPKLSLLLTALKDLEKRLQELENKMSKQHRQTKHDLQQSVKADIGVIKHKVAEEGSWTNVMVVLFVGEGFAFLMYLIWRRQTDSAYRKFI